MKYGINNTITMATPHSSMVGALLGYHYFEGVGFTKDQYTSLMKLYKYTDADAEVAAARKVHAAREIERKAEEEEKEKTRKPWDLGSKYEPEPFNEKGMTAFYEAGRDRNCFRHTSADGLRLMAILAKYVEPGEDPVKVLIQVLADSGFEVECEDLMWANGEEG